MNIIKELLVTKIAECNILNIKLMMNAKVAIYTWLASQEELRRFFWYIVSILIALDTPIY